MLTGHPMTTSGPTGGETEFPIALVAMFGCGTVELDVPMTELTVLDTAAGSLSWSVSTSRSGIADAVPLACSDKPVAWLGQLKFSAVPTDARSPMLTTQGPCPVGLGTQTPMIALPGSQTLSTTPFIPGLTGL